MALKELHTAITLLASHTNEYQSELFELQKRVMDLQEDCIVRFMLVEIHAFNYLFMHFKILYLFASFYRKLT